MVQRLSWDSGDFHCANPRHRCYAIQTLSTMGKHKVTKHGISQARHAAMAKKVKELLNNNLDLNRVSISEKEVDKYLEACKAEDKGTRLCQLLDHAHKSKEVKADALVARAAHDGHIITVRRIMQPKQKIANLNSASIRSKSAPLSAMSKAANHSASRSDDIKVPFFKRCVGMGIYGPSVKQFVADDGEDLPVITKANDVRPGAHGIVVLSGEGLAQQFAEPERYKEYTTQLIVLVPAGRFEEHLGGNKQLHDRWKAQKADVVLEDTLSKAGLRPQTVWAISLSAAPLKLKRVVPMMKLKINKTAEITMLAKRGVIPPELFETL